MSLLRHPVPPPTDARDLALAEQIRVGVIKNLLWLKHLVSYHSGRELKKIDSLVQKILVVALYQLRFLDRVPAHAALDEAVEQTRRFSRKSAAGFVNAVLRKATRQPDPPADSVEAEIRLSHPYALLERAEKLFDHPDAIEAFCRHNNAEPPTILRLLPGVDAAQLAGTGLAFTPHSAGERLVVVTGAKQPHLADWARRGLAQVQDSTSAGVVPRMRLETGMVVLDRCAGMGTKALQMSEAVGANGKVFAVDPSYARCEALRRTLMERVIANVGVVEAAWIKEAADALPKRFDRVLIDVPCSNSGVLPRRPEARYRQDKKTIKSVLELQWKIMFDTFDIVAAGGLLVYSTCSIWPEENEEFLERVLKERRDFTIIDSRTTLPTSGTGPVEYRDGGYVAVMRRFSAGSKARS